MTNHVTTQTLYIDLEGLKYTTEEAAKKANHDIELSIRKYLEECLITFSDGKLDKLATTKALWDKLEFTREWIYDTYNREGTIMNLGEALFKYDAIDKRVGIRPYWEVRDIIENLGKQLEEIINRRCSTCIYCFDNKEDTGFCEYTDGSSNNGGCEINYIDNIKTFYCSRYESKGVIND